MPAHDPIPPRQPLPPEVVAASAAVENAPTPTPAIVGETETKLEAPALIAVAPLPDAAGAHSSDTVKPPNE
jgi:hypothetical protein